MEPVVFSSWGSVALCCASCVWIGYCIARIQDIIRQRMNAESRRPTP